MSIGSEDTFIFSVLLQTKILHPLLYGLGVYVTKPGKYAMVGHPVESNLLRIVSKALKAIIVYCGYDEPQDLDWCNGC